MDSDLHEPDGISVTSAQAAWLHQRLSASTATWKIVYFHHPPYSSGASHGSTPALQWPFQQWGATAVLSGHEHDYERILHDGIPYIVNGLGGDSLYSFVTPVTESQVRFNATYGAQLIEADCNQITFQFYSIADGGTLIDSYIMNVAGANPTPTITAIPTAIPTIELTSTPTTLPTLTITPTVSDTPLPTSTPVSPITITLKASADSYISEASSNSNFGYSTQLRTDGSPIQRSYPRFDVPALLGNVTKATLRIYTNSAVGIGYKVHITTAEWDEATINFSNAPAFGNGIGNSGAIISNSWTEVDMTSAVTGTDQYNFVIDTISSRATRLSSREGANPPQLIITSDGGSLPTLTDVPTDNPTSLSTTIPAETETSTQTVIPILTSAGDSSPTLTDAPSDTPTSPSTATPAETETSTQTATTTPTAT
jgi:hypothetical protein